MGVRILARKGFVCACLAAWAAAVPANWSAPQAAVQAPAASPVASNRAIFERYVAGLTDFRGDNVSRWIDFFASATTTASHRARAYLAAATKLSEKWRAKLQEHDPPRQGAAAWVLIDVLPAHPILTASIATAATGRAKAAVYDAISQLENAGILKPLSKAQRNQSWEPVGLLDLISAMEAGRLK